MLKSYYLLTKPGLVRGNLVTTVAGFLFAARGKIDIMLLAATLVGMALIMAAGCVFNNYYDRGIDKKMTRTQHRATATGEISADKVIIFGIILSILSIITLGLFTNIVALICALIGGFVYVGLYTPLKHRSVHATLVGSISGAMPPVVGYTAVTGTIDGVALLLFIILVCWQMPHFYSVAIFRFNDYKAAQVPVLAIQKGIFVSKIQILIYINIFITATLLLTLFGYASYVYATIIFVSGLVWLGFSVLGFKTKTDDTLWARKMFVISIVVLMVLSIALSLDAVLI
jgi:protoheme IX farnesyltransferase